MAASSVRTRVERLEGFVQDAEQMLVVSWMGGEAETASAGGVTLRREPGELEHELVERLRQQAGPKTTPLMIWLDREAA